MHESASDRGAGTDGGREADERPKLRAKLDETAAALLLGAIEREKAMVL
jgi:hypothetical protein